MTDRLPAQVNGRLYGAELLLRQWEKLALESGTERALADALCDGVVLHLLVGYRLYLREIAGAYGYRGASESAAVLRGGLRREGRDGAELAVLAEAEQRGALAGLAPAWQLATGEVDEVLTTAPGLVASMGTGRPSATACREWLNWLRATIESQRGQLQEW